jgi:hypothetical protein
MHSASVSLEDLQSDQYHHFKENRQRRLHDFESVSIDRLIEHHEKNSDVHNEQEDFVNNEDLSITARYVHEMSKETIHRDNSETSHRADTHRVKSEEKLNDHCIEFECNRRFRHDVSC